MKIFKILSPLLLLVAMLMSGCGSNSKAGPIYDDPNTGDGGNVINGYKLVNITVPFDVHYAGEAKAFKVQLLQYGVPVVGATIQVAGLPAEFGIVSNASSDTDASGYATFNYVAADPLVNGVYSLDVFYEISDTSNNGDTNSTIPVEKSYVRTQLQINVQESNQGDSAGGSKIDYKLVNTTNPFLVTYANEEKTFGVQILKDSIPVKDEEVSVAALPNKYGTVSPATAKSNEAGYAIFNYLAPDQLTNGSYDLELSHTDANGTKVTNKLNIKVEEGAQEFTYQLTNASTPIILSEPNQKGLITVYLVDKEGIGVPSKTVNISILDNAYGKLTSTVAKTDTSGKASFEYTASSTLIGLGTTILTATFTENGLSTTQKIEIKAESTFDYKLVNLTTPLMIKAPSEKHDITVQLVNKNNQGVVGKDIAISALDVNYGFITPAVSTTNESGTAVFKYTAPETLIGLNNAQSTVSFTDSGLTISKLLTVSVQTAFNYQFSNPTTPLIVQTEKQESDIGVYLVDSNGLGIPNKDVSITTIDGAYGSISPTTVKTDKSGRAVYKYTGPDSLSGLKSTFAKFSFSENDLTIYKDMEIKVSPISSGTRYKLTNARTPNSITIPNQGYYPPDASEEIKRSLWYRIDVQLVRNGLPVIDARPCVTSSSTVTVDCVMPESIPRSYGRIIDAGGSTEKDGYVYFEYLGPNKTDKADVGTEYIFNIIYFDKDGKAQASTPITIEMNF